MATRQRNHQPTQAERRAAQQAGGQAPRRARSRSRPSQPRGLSRSSLIGGLLTILVVAGILIYAVTRTTASAGSAGLTDPIALNPAPAQLQTGTMAPNFTLRNVNGVSYHLAAQRGHPVLLEFFAVWCPHCQAQAPIMARLTKTYAPKGVRVWAILANPYGHNYDNSGGTDLRLADKGDLAWFARTFHVQDPMLVDPKFQVVNEYGASSYPGLYVIDRTGKITFSQAGNQSYATLAKQLDQALATSGR